MKDVAEENHIFFGPKPFTNIVENVVSIVVVLAAELSTLFQLSNSRTYGFFLVSYQDSWLTSHGSEEGSEDLAVGLHVVIERANNR